MLSHNITTVADVRRLIGSRYLSYRSLLSIGRNKQAMAREAVAQGGQRGGAETGLRTRGGLLEEAAFKLSLGG